VKWWGRGANGAGTEVAPELEAGPDQTGPLLVWGFDGTVVDSYDAIRCSVDTALCAHGLRPAGPPWVTDAILRSLVGLSLDRIFTRLVYHLDPDPSLIESLVEAYHKAFRAAAPSQARLLPGIAPLLAQLRARGAVSVVACSDGSGADLLLDRFGIAEHFADVVCDDDIDRHRRKPDPGLVLWACAAHGYEPAEAVVIGDSVFDVEMGQAAGADTVWVTWGNQSRGDLVERTPTHLAEDVGELATLLDDYVEDTATGARAATSANRRRARWAPAGRPPPAGARNHRRWVPTPCVRRNTLPGHLA
jgi:phosphoglycolate phosphatase